MKKLYFVLITTIIFCSTLAQTASDSSFYSLRILSANIGNASPHYKCWEYKLCRQQDVANFRNYIATWKPDIILLTEVMMEAQMNSDSGFGPILPKGYSFSCPKSIDRNTGNISGEKQANSSHQHECIAWKTSKLELVKGSEKSVYGRNDEYGKENCNYDFTGYRVKLYTSTDTITAITLHPNSRNAQCRTFEISLYWQELAGTSKNVLIGGDWNTSDTSEIKKPSGYQTIFSKGNYWGLRNNPKDFSAHYLYGKKSIDHVFSNFGQPCTNCGSTYGTVNLPFGAELGGYNGHPRADSGSGMDHRQILFDMKVKATAPKKLK